MRSNRVNYIYWLSQIQYSERFLVGNKLFLLSQLLQHECSILPGFVLSDNLWRQFLDELKEELPVKDFSDALATLDLDDYRILQSVANRSRQIVIRASFPQSWQANIFQAAKQLNSEQLMLQLVSSSSEHHRIDNLWRSHPCKATSEAIASTIKLVWSELFTASSLLYWHRLGLSLDRVNLSILVRPLKTAYASGIIELDRDRMRIKASWGLELALWQGDAEPDEYYLNRNTGQILTQQAGQKSYAYRLTELSTPSEQCIEAYVPEAKVSSTLVLDDRAIANLCQLIEKILTQQPQVRYLTWTALEGTHTATPNFYITSIENRLITNLSAVESQDEPISVEPLLTGVAVSPGKIQATAIAIEDLDTYTHAIPTGSILVTKAIEPQHLSLLRQVSGIITETGGTTSHGAILARELNIPAIVNVGNATKLIQNGTEVLLDGTAGKIYPPVTNFGLIDPQPSINTSHPTDLIATKLMVNLSQPESIASAIELPIDGVGLLRSELMLAEFLASQTLAQWQETFQRQFVVTLTNSLRRFSTAFAPRPVFYRSLDRYTRSPNSAYGSRGTYSYLHDPTLFDLELEALQNLIAEGQTNLNLILPFVRSVDEFEFCYRRIKNIGLTAQNSQVWMMSEVPSAILLLPEYIRAGVQGIAIGTNDLTQLLLGVDRQQTQFSDRGLNANHPAMQQAIAQLIATAHDYDIQCSICGQAPVEHPSLIEQLIRWGIDAISVEPKAVGRTYRAIARAERRILLEEVRES